MPEGTIATDPYYSDVIGPGVTILKKMATRPDYRLEGGRNTIDIEIQAIQEVTMKANRLLAALLCAALAMMGLSGFAMAEEAGEEPFSLWNADAPALNALVEYVEAVTDPDSEDFIPEADRIATFDMDGTLMGELFPTYLEVILLTERILADPSWEPDEEMIERMLDFEKSFIMLHVYEKGKMELPETAEGFAEVNVFHPVFCEDGFRR